MNLLINLANSIVAGLSWTRDQIITGLAITILVVVVPPLTKRIFSKLERMNNKQNEIARKIRQARESSSSK